MWVIIRVGTNTDSTVGYIAGELRGGYGLFDCMERYITTGQETEILDVVWGQEPRGAAVGRIEVWERHTNKKDEGG